MCGITGWWNSKSKIDHDLFYRMRDTLTHRGPDGFGSYFSADDKLALGHRRLSFLDLSDTGTQPLSNEDQTIWITINGEIYNYKELREDLVKQGHKFKSNTDSEVVIHAFEEWGMKMLDKLEGMFAFALWDEKNQKLFLARDRFGIKPLYYYFDNEQIIFASEIKAIIENKNIPREINKKSVSEYFIYRYIPSPNTIFNNIFKIEPAHYIEINSNLDIHKYEYHKFKFDNINASRKSITKKVDELVRRSVGIHIRSDVPVGSFLSGGYDSSLMVKYFSELKEGINTFSIGFDNWDKSEHKYAKIVSDKFKTNHKSEILGQESLDILDMLMYYYDEPIADISIIPTYQVSKLASENNKAVLSGEGADEFFAGYTWHRDYLWHVDKKQIRDSKKWGWELPINNFDIDSYSKAMAMGNFDKDELTELLHPDFHSNIPEDTSEFYRKFYDESLPIPKRFQFIDIKCFMGELVLTKVDRASMANSLEVRVPFLNKEISSLMLSLDQKVYYDKKKQKVLLRNILKKDLPKEIIERKKQGFTGPDDYYMDFDWYKNNLKNSELIKAKIINKKAVEKYLDEKDHWRLWKVAVLEKWYKKWLCQ
ncbi:MAG: asparagine synthase (glutamine-hydrolyzing) [Marinilabiliales bacterium]|nr:MAG: asparagine synthase (glutamine-hydrolyzing) [Marinilabiliales bacterium]